MPANWRVSIVFTIYFLLFFGAPVAPIFSAAAPTFSDLPDNIESSQELEVSTSYIGDPRYYANKTYYLRGVFFQTSGKYNGFTQSNAGGWVNSASDTTKLYEINTNEEGSWSGKLKVKVDPDSSYFKGSGNYSFKIGRYTASGGNAVWSQEQTLNINAPPTPKPAANPAPTNTPTPTTDNEEKKEILTTESQKIIKTPVGVVAGIKTDLHQEDNQSTTSSNLEINPTVTSTNSSSVSPVKTQEPNQKKQQTPANFNHFRCISFLRYHCHYLPQEIQ